MTSTDLCLVLLVSSSLLLLHFYEHISGFLRKKNMEASTRKSFAKVFLISFILIGILFSYTNIYCIDIELFWSEKYILRIPQPFLICISLAVILLLYPVYFPSLFLSLISVVVYIHFHDYTRSYVALITIIVLLTVVKPLHKQLHIKT